ncbi:MAG: ATPase [Gammaproteobacteria bacterium]|nr:ATPase [Gammaproteobacteria bacterium]
MLSSAYSEAAHAEVTVVSEQGFVSEHELDIAADPERVYQTLTDEIHLWWDATHSYSGKAENFYLEARAQGCFCEKLSSGGSVRHMQVVFADPGKQLRLSGGLGPLQGMGVAGSMSFVLVSRAPGTRLEYRYEVGGFTAGGLAALAGPVDPVQLGQLQRLKAYVEGSL